MRRATPAAVAPQPVHRMMSVIGGASGVRFEIVMALATRPRDVGTLAADFKLDQPTISHHLSELRKAGVVSAEVFAGRKVYSVGNGNGSVRVRREQGLVVVELTDADGGRVALAQDRSPPAPSDDHASPAVQVVMNLLRQDRRA